MEIKNAKISSSSLGLVFTIELNGVADKCLDYAQKEGKRWFE